MDREILFRGKRIDNGEWVEGAFYAYYDFEKTIVQILKDRTNGIPDTYEVIPSTVGQFTGLTDKKGKKIFEGDILGFENVKGVVKWSENISCFTYEWKTYDCGKRTTIYDRCRYGLLRICILTNFSRSKELEVIGNIYDNPELLKDGE